MIFLRLFYEFFMTGLFMFGGGMAAIPFLQQMSEKTGWFTLEQLMDMVAVTEISPGPLAVDMATYAGYVTAGLPGGIIATLGLLAPTIIVALIVARLLARFKESSAVQSMFYGLRPASLGLIGAAGIAVLRMSLLNSELWEQTGLLTDLIDIKATILAVVLFILINRLKANPVFFLIGSAVVGLLIM